MTVHTQIHTVIVPSLIAERLIEWICGPVGRLMWAIIRLLTALSADFNHYFK